jgi:hypothetical protein
VLVVPRFYCTSISSYVLLRFLGVVDTTCTGCSMGVLIYSFINTISLVLLLRGVSSYSFVRRFLFWVESLGLCTLDMALEPFLLWICCWMSCGLWLRALSMTASLFDWSCLSIYFCFSINYLYSFRVLL